MSDRVTHVVVEVLRVPTPALRATQVPVEVLRVPSPNVRITGAVVEVLRIISAVGNTARSYVAGMIG